MSSAHRQNNSSCISETEKKGALNVALIPSKDVYAHACFLEDFLHI